MNSDAACRCSRPIANAHFSSRSELANRSWLILDAQERLGREVFERLQLGERNKNHEGLKIWNTGLYIYRDCSLPGRQRYPDAYS